MAVLAVTIRRVDIWQNKEKIGYLDQGRQVSIIDSDDEWSKVIVIGGYHNTKKVWLKGDALEAISGKQSSSDSSCFPSETNIITPYGQVKIACMQPNADIISYDPNYDTLHTRRVLKVIKYFSSNILSIYFEDGRLLRATGHHTMLTARGWSRIKNLHPGDCIMRYNDGMLSAATVLAVCRENKPEAVFNLITEGEHTFLAEGFVAHNFTNFRRSRMILYKALSYAEARAKRLVSQEPSVCVLRAPSQIANFKQ